MENLIDKSFDKQFEAINNLTWLPWIGKYYNNDRRKLLIVGESIYNNEYNNIPYEELFERNIKDKEFARKSIYQPTISEDYVSKTYDNIHRVFLETNDFNKELFWENVAYYNFIQRLMDWRKKERPNWSDYYSSWQIFIKIIQILKPTDCIFIGVEAANSFNLSMEELKIDFSPVEKFDGIGTAYPRISKLKSDEYKLKITFIQHTSQYFSWKNWHAFLEKQNIEIINYLRNIVLE